MLFEYISTTIVLILSLIVLWIAYYILSIQRALGKYLDIPGPKSRGIKVSQCPIFLH